jgi:hypothetical protein
VNRVTSDEWQESWHRSAESDPTDSFTSASGQKYIPCSEQEICPIFASRDIAAIEVNAGY